jgi:hypothetical protein
VVKTVIRVTLPDELLQAFYQAIRDFDTRHDPDHEGMIHIEMLTEADWPAEKMAEVMSSVDPKPKYLYTGSTGGKR